MRDQERTSLVRAALAARERAYAPYSGFRSGAAILTDSGGLYQGVLVENLIFGLAMCAERVALFGLVAAGEGRPVALAVASPRTVGRRTFPCGPCLQVAIEFGGPELAVLAVDPIDESHEARTIAELAPAIPYRRMRG